MNSAYVQLTEEQIRIRAYGEEWNQKQHEKDKPKESTKFAEELVSSI